MYLMELQSGLKYYKNWSSKKTKEQRLSDIIWILNATSDTSTRASLRCLGGPEAASGPPIE